ncbi:MAG: hypothetical protein KAS29_16765 [Bacteroidales bacterium]|nr:hypothetical protein [Bacteroidales bacterium]
MNLSTHQRIARILFWVAQAIGIFTGLALTVFIGGNLISELIEGLITIKEEYGLFIILLCEILVIVSFVISWNRKRLGPILVLVFTILILLLWGWEDMNIVLLHLPILFSGILLLFYYYYKEWILKQKA